MKSTQTLYIRYSDYIRADIMAKRLHPGQRLPSIRTFAKQHNISITTALNCFHHLEENGYIQAIAQSGYYVSATTHALDKPTAPVFKPQTVTGDNANLIHSIDLAERNPDNIPLGTAVLSEELVPSDLLNRSLIRANRRNTALSRAYPHPNGEPRLRDAISRLMANYSINASNEDILITNGVMEAVSLAISATTSAGDCIAVPSPCFSGLLRLLECLDRKILELPTQPDSQFDIDWLANLLKQQQVQAVLFTSVNQNPLGFTLNTEQKQSLATLAQTLDIPFIEDDAFGDCSFADHERIPTKAFDRSDNIIYCNSFSKTLAPGYRLGWCVPGKYNTLIQQQKVAISLGSNTPLQLALADFIFSGEYQKHLKNIKTLIRKNINLVSQAVEQYFPENTKVTQPNGFYAIWIELPNSINALEVYKLALKKNISIVPGNVFSTSDIYDHYIRINAGNLWSVRIERAIEALGDLVKHRNA